MSGILHKLADLWVLPSKYRDFTEKISCIFEKELL